MKEPVIYEQLGKLFFETHLAEIFGLDLKDNLKNDKNHKAALLIGFLKEAADGNLEDPNNIQKWEQTGESLLKS